MKKYILFLLTILVVLGTTLVTNMMMINDNINKSFTDSGYILKNSDDSERYHFSEESTYKNSYNDQIVFNDTEGEKVVVNKHNFIHYEDGSISSFTKGVLLDLDTIDTEPITYYNISANKVLKKLSNNKYITKNLDKELQFTNLMWRISESKYLVAGNAITILFADGTEKQISGFLEIEYSDNEIVNIFNQEVSYETISSEVYLKIGDNVKINLGTKIVSKNDINEMTLENMVIDSNDNITIIDMEEYKEDEENDNENTTTSSGSTGGGSTGGSVSGIQGGNAGSVSGGDSIANGGTTIVGGTTEDNGSDDNDSEGDNNNNNSGNGGNVGGNIEVEVQDDLSVYAPKYTIKEFQVSATGVRTKVEIEDDEARLTTGTFTYILDNTTGKMVYPSDQNPIEDRRTEITLDTATLEPNKEYTLVMEASYAIDDAEYQKNFIYKIFRTKGLGIILEKDMFTSETLAFNIKFEHDSPVTKLDVELVENGQVRTEIANSGNASRIEFTELTPDTEYTLRIKNIYVGNVTNSNTYSYKYKTLKEIPKINGELEYTDLQVEINKRDNKFVLTIPGLEEGVVETLNYQIYTVTEDVRTLVYSKVTSETKLTLPVGENEKLHRNTDYIASVLATFYDNEKAIEYEIANSVSSFSLNSSEMPTVRFEMSEEDGVTGNSIKGTLVIDDEGNTIRTDTAKIEIIYNSTTKDVDDNGTISVEGISEDLTIPFEIRGLKSLETYKLSVYGTFDLHDGNGERYGYIGSILITTREHDAVRAIWTAGREGVDATLALTRTGNSNNEMMSLKSFEIELYGGQAGSGGRKLGQTYRAIDSGENGNFESSLNMEYGYRTPEDEGGANSGKTLKGSHFGLTPAEIETIRREYTWVTILIKNAKAIDYTKHENRISIESASFTYPTQDIQLTEPSDSINSVKINQIRKQILENEKNNVNRIISTNGYTVDNNTNEITKPDNYNIINNSTIVAYKVSANLSETQVTQLYDGGYRYIAYSVYIDGQTEPVVTSGMVEWTSRTSIPSAMFLISNGTEYGINDFEYLARGNKYYFTYTVYSDVNDPDACYPSTGYWNSNAKPTATTNKQETNVIMYPSTSDNDSISYKYKIDDVDCALGRDTSTSGDERYFYQYYGSVPEFENNKKQIQFGNNIEENSNGFYTVRFDNLSTKTKNLNLEVKILHSINKSVPPSYRTLTTQKLEDVISLNDVTMNLENINGIGARISFNNLTEAQKSRISQIKIELIDRETDEDERIDNIVITKTNRDLTNNNWRIDVNYLEQIYKYGESLKNKEFSVSAKVYYISGVAGYDNEDDAVAYQKIDGKWLQIYNREFRLSNTNDNNITNITTYESHEYHFENDLMLIRDRINQNEISGLNYSDKGLLTNINGEDTVVIPKKVELYEMNGLSIDLSYVIPGVSLGNVTCITGPTNIVITLDSIFAKDTIIDETPTYTTNDDITSVSDVYVELYRNSGSMLDVANFNDNNVEFTGLEQGQDYYYRLYVIDEDGRHVYLYDRNSKTAGIMYTCKTIRNVTVEDLAVNYNSREETIEITHDADILNGYYGFEYNIYDKTTSRLEIGPIRVPLEEFKNSNKCISITTNSVSGQFAGFEFGKQYKITVTPIIYNSTDDEYETTIGGPYECELIYNYQTPTTSIYVKRLADGVSETYSIQFDISILDNDYMISSEQFSYNIYNVRTGNVVQSNTCTLGQRVTYESIVYNIPADNSSRFEDSYRIEIEYNYYTSNRKTAEGPTETENVSKILAEMENNISTGIQRWSFTDNSTIKVEFKDSYNLESIKTVQCTIYDADSKVLQNFRRQVSINSVENPEGFNKTINISTDNELEAGKSYRIAIAFYNDTGSIIARFEPDNFVTNNFIEEVEE